VTWRLSMPRNLAALSWVPSPSWVRRPYLAAAIFELDGYIHRLEVGVGEEWKLVNALDAFGGGDCVRIESGIGGVPELLSVEAARSCAVRDSVDSSWKSPGFHSMSSALRPCMAAHVLVATMATGLTPQNETAFLQHLAGKGTASGEETSRQIPFVIPADGGGADEGLSQRVAA
jgi:hypothetical protein